VGARRRIRGAVHGRHADSSGVAARYRAASVDGSEQPVTATFANVNQEGYWSPRRWESAAAAVDYAFVGSVFDLITTAVYTRDRRLLRRDIAHGG